MASKRLEGKVAIVTGAASGIGEATACLLAEHGAYVILADIQDVLGEQVAATIGSAATYVHCDVTVEVEVASMVQLAVDKHGRLDIMHSNTSRLGKQRSLLDMDLEEFDHIMATNLRGAAAAIKHAAKAMVRKEVHGSIVCTASSTALVGGTAPHAYTTSKSALVGLVRSTASEL
ncbi:hypothetical protein SUGI_1126670 [Cryptomeria japonica]|nr:hypothetical protein SUGI_1126670 [Cryptomeria japonica]